MERPEGCAILHGWRTCAGFLRRKRAYAFPVHLSRIELMGIVTDATTGTRYTRLSLSVPWGTDPVTVYVTEPRHALQEMVQQTMAAEAGNDA